MSSGARRPVEHALGHGRHELQFLAGVQRASWKRSRRFLLARHVERAPNRTRRHQVQCPAPSRRGNRSRRSMRAELECLERADLLRQSACWLSPLASMPSGVRAAEQARCRDVADRRDELAVGVEDVLGAGEVVGAVSNLLAAARSRDRQIETVALYRLSAVARMTMRSPARCQFSRMPPCRSARGCRSAEACLVEQSRERRIGPRRCPSPRRAPAVRCFRPRCRRHRPRRASWRAQPLCRRGTGSRDEGGYPPAQSSAPCATMTGSP